MTMPIDFAIIRHAESEQNLANAFARKGQADRIPDEYYDRHSSEARATDKGIIQAQITGAWIPDHFSLPFGRYVCSGYVRAMETAGHLGIPGARWHRDMRIRERDMGDFDVAHFDAEDLRERDADPFHWKPRNGESMADVCRRLVAPLLMVQDACAETSAVWVTHGDLMWGIRAMLEHRTQQEWEALYLSKEPFDTIHNCQILHYTRRDPETGVVRRHPSWMRSILPEDPSRSSNAWQPILRWSQGPEDLFTPWMRATLLDDSRRLSNMRQPALRRSFSSEELLAEVARIPRMVHDTPH